MGTVALLLSSKEQNRRHPEGSDVEKSTACLRAWISTLLGISWKKLKILTH